MEEDVNVIEGGKIIAAFDGYEILPNDLAIIGRMPYKAIGVEFLKYHSDWNLLMPVWKKVGGKMYEIRRTVSGEEYQRAAVLTQHILNALREVDINSAFLWVVESVKWLNNNQQSK